MEDIDKEKGQSKRETPDLSKAREEYEREVLNSEMGTEMLDYGSGGPGAGRDDSSTRSNAGTDKTPNQTEEGELDQENEGMD